jgi:hypothetical protein
LEFPLFPPSLHNTCSCYYLHSQIDADKDSVFWLVNLHPSWKKIGCISIPSKSVQVFWFKFLVWYTRSKNLNSRNLNGDLDAKLASCIPGLKQILTMVYSANLSLMSSGLIKIKLLQVSLYCRRLRWDQKIYHIPFLCTKYYKGYSVQDINQDSVRVPLLRKNM